MLLVSGPLGWILGMLLLLLLLLTPVLLIHPAVMPLAADDAKISQSLSRIEKSLVRAGKRLKAGELSVSAYVSELQAARAVLRETQPPDGEWEARLLRLDKELSNTIENAEGTAAHTDLREQRAAIREFHTGLVQKRLRFWH